MGVMYPTVLVCLRRLSFPPINQPICSPIRNKKKKQEAWYSGSPAAATYSTTTPTSLVKKKTINEKKRKTFLFLLDYYLSLVFLCETKNKKGQKKKNKSNKISYILDNQTSFECFYFGCYRVHIFLVCVAARLISFKSKGGRHHFVWRANWLRHASTVTGPLQKADGSRVQRRPSAGSIPSASCDELPRRSPGKNDKAQGVHGGILNLHESCHFVFSTTWPRTNGDPSAPLIGRFLVTWQTLSSLSVSVQILPVKSVEYLGSLLNFKWAILS